MQTKHQLREEIIRLKCRVEALEDLICPGGEHDFFTIKHWAETIDGFDFQDYAKIKCKRCGKVAIRGDWT